MATTRPFVDSTLLILMTLQKQGGRDLREVSSGIREAVKEYQDKVKDLNTLLPIIRFEREIATTRFNIKNHNKDSNSLRASMNATQTHIDKLYGDKVITSDTSQKLSEEIKKIDKDLVTHENNFNILSNAYLKLCDERLQAKRANNFAELGKIENTLRTDLLPKIENAFQEEEKLHTRIRTVYKDTANAAKARGVIISEPMMDLPRASKP